MPTRRNKEDIKFSLRQRLGKDARPVPGHHVEQATQQAVEGLEEVERRHFVFWRERKESEMLSFFFSLTPRKKESGGAVLFCFSEEEEDDNPQRALRFETEGCMRGR